MILIKKRLKNENNIVTDKIILLISVVNVKSKLSLGKNPPEDIMERE